MKWPCLLLIGTAFHPGLPAQSMDAMLDRFSEDIAFASGDGQFRTQVSGTFDVDLYAFDGRPPGFIQTDDEWLIQPRLTVFLDVQAGPRVYGFAQARVDRGFDPAKGDFEVRLDEYALRYTPLKEGYLSVQVGQYATIIGQWVQRHLSWQNPFVTAPLIYENPTRLSDIYPPRSEYSLIYPVYEDSYYYNSIIWGASYGTGAAVSGRIERLEWQLEIKNTALMSRPELWPITEIGFDAPTVSGRFAWKPDLRWTFGLSASDGAFAGEEYHNGEREDYRQKLVMFDISFEHRHLQVWAEYVVSSFSLPEFADNLVTQAWFIEARYKIAPRLSLALRLNGQRFSDIHYYGERIGQWGDDVRRIDLAATWRFNAHSQLIVELDGYDYAGSRQDHVVLAARITLRF